MRTGRHLQRTAVALLLALTTGCAGGTAATVTGSSGSGGSGAGRTIHDAAQAKARWTAVRPQHYRFTYLPSCFCGLRTGQVNVTDGTVAAWEPRPRAGSTSGGSALWAGDAPTIDELIATAAKAEHEATGLVSITYDPATGIPVDASIDWVKETIDDELTWRITGFEVLPVAPTS